MNKVTSASRKGALVVLSAPSGAGKTSLCRAAMERLSHLTHSTSFTTRSPRPGEVNGRDYAFVDEETFEAMVREGEFLEWARVHGNLYGTSKKSVQEILERGSDVILDIDAQGARTLMSQSELQGVFVFVLPPSFAELERRLRDRDSDAEEEIQRRLQQAREEVAELDKYDYLLVNDDFEQALNDLISILYAVRCSVNLIDHEWVERDFFKK